MELSAIHKHSYVMVRCSALSSVEYSYAVSFTITKLVLVGQEIPTTLVDVDPRGAVKGLR